MSSYACAFIIIVIIFPAVDFFDPHDMFDHCLFEGPTSLWVSKVLVGCCFSGFVHTA